MDQDELDEYALEGFKNQTPYIKFIWNSPPFKELSTPDKLVRTAVVLLAYGAVVITTKTQKIFKK